MLSNLRAGTPVYILYKNEPRFAVGKISQVSNQYPNLGYQQQPLVPGNNLAVNLVVEVDGKLEPYERIPLNSSIAEFPEKGVIISETRDGIINEVNAIKSASVTALQQVDMHKNVIASCDKLLFDLNPQLRKEQEQAQEIATLKEQLSGMSEQIAGLTAMLSKSLGKTKKEE